MLFLFFVDGMNKVVRFPTQEEIVFIKNYIPECNLSQELQGVLIAIEEEWMDAQIYIECYADQIFQLLQKAIDTQRSFDCFQSYIKKHRINPDDQKPMIFLLNTDCLPQSSKMYNVMDQNKIFFPNDSFNEYILSFLHIN
jgi:hypothetical protein